MKKKFVSIFLVLMMCVSVLTGCSLVTRNDEKFYNAVVCTITYSDGVKENITKRDLISAFNSYGYNYVQSYGLTTKKAVKQTLTTLTNQRLTIKAVKDYYASIDEPLFTDNEKTYLYDLTFETMLDNLKEYYREVANIKTDDSAEQESTDADMAVFKQYVPKARVVKVETTDGVDYVIRNTTKASTTRADYEVKTDDNGNVFDFEYEDAEGKKPFQEKMYADIVSRTEGKTTSARNWRGALNEYMATIRENYTYKNLSDNKACFMFEMDRVYNILKDNYIVEKYSEIYNRQSHQDSDLSNVTVGDVLKAYSAKVQADYANTSSFESNILSDVGNVDYIVPGSSYFYTAYVKLAFTAEQQAKYDSLQNNAYLSEQERQTQIQSIYDGMVAKVRDEKTGEETGETVSTTKLLSDIQNAVEAPKYRNLEEEWQALLGREEFDSDAQRQQAYEELKTLIEGYNKSIEIQKAEAFRKFLYLYNDDDSQKGADYNTVFGVSETNTVLSSSFTDNEPVNDAILELFKNGQAQVGDITGLVQSKDGIYLFFYAGKIENLFAVNGDDFDISTDKQNINVLTSKRINIFSEKTLFDVLFEELSTNNFSTFQNMNIQNLRDQTKSIKEFKNNLKDL